MLRMEMRRRDESFEQVLNDAIRAGLRKMGKKRRDQAFKPLIFDMGQPRVDISKAAVLAADLEDEDTIRRYRRGR